MNLSDLYLPLRSFISLVKFVGILFGKLSHLYLKLRWVIIFRLILIENQDDVHFGDFSLVVFVLFQPVKMAKFIGWVGRWVVAWLVLEVRQHCAQPASVSAK